MFKKIMGAFSKDEEETDSAVEQPKPVQPAADGAAAAPAAPAGNAEATSPSAPSTAEPVENEALRGRIEDAIRTIYDPEIPVNIYDIGLIYEITPRSDDTVYVQMTLTSPSCPAAGILPGQVESKVRSVEGVHDCELDLVFDPPWTPDRMSEAARLELGMM